MVKTKNVVISAHVDSGTPLGINIRFNDDIYDCEGVEILEKLEIVCASFIEAYFAQKIDNEVVLEKELVA